MRRNRLELILRILSLALTPELHTFEQGPLEVDACAPRADGTGPIGPPIPLFPVDP